MSALSLSPPFSPCSQQQSKREHNTVEHMNCLSVCTYKVTEFNNKYFLEVFVGSSKSDPFIEEEWFRVEVKIFKTLDEANQYMEENY